MGDNGTAAVMEGCLQALLDRGDFARFFALDVTWTSMDTGDQVVGPEAVRDLIVALHTQMFDASPMFVGLLTGDGTAMLAARFVGRHTGQFGDVAPTGRSVDLPYAVSYDRRDGKITALRGYLPLAALRAS